MSEAILIVDDEEMVLNALRRTLDDEEYQVHTATSGAEGLELARRYKFKVVISDERMPEMSGVEFLSLLSLRSPDTVRMLLTGHASLDAAVTAVNRGEVYRFLTKPWSEAELKLAVCGAIEKFDQEAQSRRLMAQARTSGLRPAREGGADTDRTGGKGGSSRYVLPELSDEEAARLLEEVRPKGEYE